MFDELVVASYQERPTEEPHISTTASKLTTVNFLEGPRMVSGDVLRSHDITQHHVTPFYRRQIQKSGYYDQLKYIVEPSILEFASPGSLDTSGEHENTVVTGLQHKYAQTGLLLVTDRCASYCRYCFRKRIVGNDSE